MTTAPEIEGDDTPPIFPLMNKHFIRNPYPTLSLLRESSGATPIVTNGMRMWLVTRYADVRRLLADPALEKNLVVGRDEIAHCMVAPEQHSKMPRQLRSSMFEQDGANHRRLRGLLSGIFTPKKVAAFEPQIERVAAELLDHLPVGEPVNLMTAYVKPLVTTVLSDFVGVPEDLREDFPEWGNLMLTAPTAEEITEAARGMHEFCQEMVALKHREPRDDLFSKLVEMEREGLMTYEETTATTFLLLTGGVEPISAMSNAALALLAHPDQLAKVQADPALWSGCVDEALRYETSFRILPPRHCREPIDLGDVQIPAHELIVVANSAANRDPAQFTNPDDFDVTRDARDHLAFGYGPHRCLGVALGKMELTIGLRGLFSRFPATTLTKAAEDLRWRPGPFLRRLEALPVVLG